MDWHVQGLPRNVLQIRFSPAKMATNTAKKYKTNKMKEIISAVCALLNSGGGKLALCFDNTTTKQHKDACIRMIEQRVVEMVGVTTKASHMKFEVNSPGIILHIREASKLESVNYNFCLPSESQVNAVPSTQSADEIKEITQRIIVSRMSVSIGSHSKRFVKGQTSGLDESSNVQNKYLKASSSKCVTLADRITGKSNKLTSYVSSFANHYGGHIYYGVDDEGIVDGEQIKEEEKDEIMKKVAKTINKMVWPQNSCHVPQRGKHWDIFFEPVEDSSGSPIPSTFVIVISVPPILGGVFTEEPESYYIVEDKVIRMSFPDWWRHFTGVAKRFEFLSVSSCVSRVQWSSEKNRNICRTLRERLVQYRNDENMRDFNALSQLAMARFPESGADLIVKADQIVVAYKHHHFNKAESLLEEFVSLVTHSKDRSIFEVTILRLRSMIEHSKGNYELSYKIAEDGLQMMQQIPIDLITIGFYIHTAMVTINSTRAHDSKTCRFLKNESLHYLELATRDATSLEDLENKTSDFQQKLHIYKAWILLGYSVTGTVVLQEHDTNKEDIEAAAGELLCVSQSVLKGSPLTHFRKIQYDLAQCDLFHRRSEIQPREYIQYLKLAYECGSKARSLARKHHFENMGNYASKRLADLTEKLVCHAIQTRKGHANNNFFGFNY